MTMDIGEFLEDRVWPELDAAASNLLEELRPQKTGSSYKLNCPSCGKRRAYYYPGRSIRCNREESCGYSSSVWNYLIDQGMQKKEVVQAVCNAVGVEPPDNRTNKQSNTPSVDIQVFRILQKAFEQCIPTIQRKWKYSPDDLKVLSRYCGYYKSPDYLRSKLPQKLHDEAERLGWFSPSLKNRLFGWWKQPSGGIGYWARALDNAEPKYLFRSGMLKSIPYLCSEATPSKPLLAVEGGRDVLALKMMGYRNAIGIGGANFTFPQCRFLATRFQHIIHIVDGDLAGLKGVITTIENASEFGLRMEFVIIPTDSDKDADDYRAEKDHLGFKSLYDSRVSAGVALALAYAKLQSENQVNELRGKILSARSSLSPTDQKDFSQALTQFGINEDYRREAIHDLSQLMNHFSFEEANRIVSQRHGFSFEVIRSDSDA